MSMMVANKIPRSSGEKNALLEKVRRLAEADSKKLEERKEDIKELYHNEMEGWKMMLEGKSHISVDERMKEIQARAFQLRAVQEAERKLYIKDCYDRQWRAKLLHDWTLSDDIQPIPGGKGGGGGGKAMTNGGSWCEMQTKGKDSRQD